MFLRRSLTLAAVLILLDFASGARLVGESKCVWGPSYWCSGLPQSAKCSSTSFCIDGVWKSNPYPADDDDVCKICKNMVKEARDQLESNETQTEIKEVFEGSCRLIPIKIVAEECVKLSDQFIVELIEMLASEMDPETVCTVSGLCNSGRIDRMIKEFLERNIRTDCDVCHEQMQKMSFRVRLMSKDKVLDKGLEMCGRLSSSYSDACKMLLLDNFGIVYDSLTHLDFACESSAICSDSYKGVATTLAPVADLECEFCEKVIQHWIDEWKSNSSMEEFKQVLEAFCDKLGQPDRIKRCFNIVDDYYIPIFKYILNVLNPQEACAAAGLCGSNGFMEVNPSVPISVLLPVDEDFLERKQLLGIEDAPPEEVDENRLIGGYFVPQTFLAMSKPGCPICEFVLYRLREWLQDERTKDEIDRELSAICSAMPSSLGNQCNSFVETYGPAVIEAIIEGADPKLICTVLNLCDDDGLQKPLFVTSNSTPNVVAEMKEKDDECATCQYVTSFVIEALGNVDDQDEIRNVLDSVCTLMPSSMADRCETYVNAYSEMVMQMIADNLSADQICEGLGLCKRRKVDDKKCVICEYVISTLDSIIEDKSNEDSIKRALDNVCGYLPKTVTKECVSFVDTYTEEIIDLLAHGTSPEEVCTSIGLCQGSNDSSSSSSSEEDSSEEDYDEAGLKDDRPYCMLCEYAIGEVDHIVDDKQNEEEVKQALDNICYKLSKPITKECLAMVNKYTDEIIQMFVNDYTPERVCAALQLCKEREATEEQIKLSNAIGQHFVAPVGNDLQTAEDGKLCDICEFGISVVENRILNGRNLDMVEHAVLMMCSYLPSSVADKCEELIERYGDQIIHLIVNSELTPKEVCSELHLCAKATLWDASSIGGHRCVWGPAFWCKSAFHASACGTTEYCVRSGKLHY